MRKLIAGILLCLLASLATAAELVDPSPIPLPATLPAADVPHAVKLAVLRSKWEVESEEPGRIVARYAPRSHVARVTIAWDAAQLSVRYLDSSNLDFEQDGAARSIHRAYNQWLEQLVAELARFRTDGDPAALQEAAHSAASQRQADMFPTNPPPSEKLSAFGRFEIAKLTLAPAYAGQDANERAAAKIQENMDIGLVATVNSWNQAPKGPPERVLRIEPVVEEIRFIGTGARIFVGAMAGGSRVSLRVRFTDVATGKTIAEPVFYLRSGGRNSFMGIGDNMLLPSIANMARDYAVENYTEAVGGPAGDRR